MATGTLPDPPDLLKKQENLYGHICKAEAMVEILLVKDLADCLSAKQHLYEYFCVMGDLLLEAMECSEDLISQMIKSMGCPDDSVDPQH